MAQELQFRTIDADTWKGLEKIQFKISRRAKKLLTQDVTTFKGIGSQLVLSPYAVPSFLGAEGIFGALLESGMEGYSGFQRDHIKRIEWEIPRPEDTFRTSLSRNEMFKREQQAFLRLKHSLLGQETYINKFVAVLGGEVVDLDNDIRNLAKRVYSKYGYVPIYMEKVQKERTVEQLPSPER